MAADNFGDSLSSVIHAAYDHGPRELASGRGGSMARVGNVRRWATGIAVIGAIAVLGLWFSGVGCWLWHQATLLTSGAWSAIAAWATFLVAAIAAGFAYFQVRVARQTREEQAQPNVVAFAESTPQHMQFLDIVIRNFGSTPPIT